MVLLGVIGMLRKVKKIVWMCINYLYVNFIF